MHFFHWSIYITFFQQEYGMTRAEKLTIAQGICAPLLRKIRADLQRNAMEMEDDDEEDQTVNRLDPRLEGAIKKFQGF